MAKTRQKNCLDKKIRMNAAAVILKEPKGFIFKLLRVRKKEREREVERGRVERIRKKKFQMI
jgi:hypothetical protein